jgi:hypothetical protein
MISKRSWFGSMIGGLIVRVQKQPVSVHPQHLVRKGIRPFDWVDAVAADVCAVPKCRDERFESEEDLCSWLDEDGVSWAHDPRSALDDLESIGRLRRPRQDQWRRRRSDLPLPGIYVEPRTHNE